MDTLDTIELSVPDITCGHCEQAIHTSLGAVPGISEVVVDLDARTVWVTGDAERSVIVAAIEDAGYDVRSDVGSEVGSASGRGSC